MKASNTPPEVKQEKARYYYDLLKGTFRTISSFSPATDPRPAYLSTNVKMGNVADLKATDAPMLCVTSSYQTRFHDDIRGVGFRQIVIFPSAHGIRSEELILWIKSREGDKRAMYAPRISAIKDPITRKKQTLPVSDRESFTGCCGAVVSSYDPKADKAVDLDGDIPRHPETHRTWPSCADLSNHNSCFTVAYLCVCAVRLEDSVRIEAMKDQGFLPIYRYSTPEGVDMFIMCRAPDCKMQTTLIGRTKKPFVDIIKRLQGVK